MVEEDAIEYSFYIISRLLPRLSGQNDFRAPVAIRGESPFLLLRREKSFVGLI